MCLIVLGMELVAFMVIGLKTKFFGRALALLMTRNALG
jgi:hypothetical protein